MQELKVKVRTAIQSSALNEFLKKGYRDTSIRSIAQKAGITHGNIYRYFPNKKALLSAGRKLH